MERVNLLKTKNSSFPSTLSQKRAYGAKRVLGLVICGVIGAGVVIVIAVTFSPLTDEDSKTHDTEFESATTVGQSDATAFSGLPSVPQVVNTEVLQSELRQLADAMVARYPQDPASFHLAGRIYSSLKQTKDAERLWSKSVELNCKQTGPYVGLARIWITLGREQEALTLLEKTKHAVGVSGELLSSLGECQENSGALENARDSYLACTKLEPNTAGVWQSLGRVQNQLGLFEDAETSLRKSIELNGPTVPALLTLSAVLVRQKRTDEATELRRQITELQAFEGPQERTFQQQYDDALRGIAADMFVGAAEVDEQNGKLLEAGEDCLKSISYQPRQLKAYQLLSAIYHKAGRLPDVIVIQKRLLELQPNNPLNYLNLASLLLQVGDAEAAEVRLRQAVEIDPNGTIAQIALARLCLTTGKLTDARTLASEIVERSHSIEGYQLLGETMEAAGDSVSAKLVAEKIEQLRTTATRVEN